MYDKIGGKIKKLAVWIFIIEAFAAVTGGIFIRDIILQKGEFNEFRNRCFL